jgi:Sulfotransferase domain
MEASKSINISVAPEQQKLALEIQDDVTRGLDYLKNSYPERAILAFKLAREKSQSGTQIFDIITHNLLTAYRGTIEQLVKKNDVAQVNIYISEVQQLALTSEMGDDEEFRGRFADVFKNLGMDLYNGRHYEASLYFFRRAISIKPCPTYFVDLTNALAFIKSPARLSDYTVDYQANDLGRHIFIACSPKSGSTFIKNLLVGLTGFKDLFSVYAALQNEHDLDLPQITKFGRQNTVTQQHSRATEANIQMMQAFGIRPIILVRNIYDSAVSLLDFYTKGFTFSTFFSKEEFLNFSENQKIDLLIDYALPWYFQFVASWQKVEKEKRLDIKWLTYEEMIADKPSTVANILDFYGMSIDKSAIVQKIVEIESDAEKNRFNKGVSGRGKIVLSPEQKTRIANLARHFPSNNFEIIGL